MYFFSWPYTIFKNKLCNISFYWKIDLKVVQWMVYTSDTALSIFFKCTSTSTIYRWYFLLKKIHEYLIQHSLESGGIKVRGKRFTVCTEIAIILEMIWFTISGGCLRYKRYDAHFLRKKGRVELPFSSFGDHLINILRKVNRLIYAFKIN